MLKLLIKKILHAWTTDNLRKYIISCPTFFKQTKTCAVQLHQRSNTALAQE